MMHAIVALWLAVASQRQKIDAATAMAERHEYAKCRDTLAPVIKTATGDERSLRAYPHQADAMFLLGMAFEERNYRIQAILAYLRFLAMEPTTERSRLVAHKTITLLNSGGPKPERRPAEGDYGPAELLLTLAKAPDRDSSVAPEGTKAEGDRLHQ